MAKGATPGKASKARPRPAARPAADAPAPSTADAPSEGAPPSSQPTAAVEQRAEGALGGVEARLHELVARAGVPEMEEELREALGRLVPILKQKLAATLDLVRLLEPPDRLDRYGMDARFSERLATVVDLLYTTWWRVEVSEVARVPAAGPAVVVANHAGLVPWDAFVLRHALRREHPARRELRPLLDDRECALPVVGAAAVRYGAVRAGAEAAEGILRDGDLVGVFPEGSQGARKAWRDRYQILRFGRGGFAKLALRAGAPIVPCAILGSEEASPGISRPGWLADRLGIPLLSGNPALRIGAAAFVPLPSKWSIRFGEPFDTSAMGRGAADDPGAVSDLTARVRSALQGMLDQAVAARGSVYL